MRTIRTVAEMRAHVRRARENDPARPSIALVPTMGAFHAGHEALMRAAREAADEVIVSLFVNPTQFDDPSDLAAYPRAEEEDAAMAAELGVDVLFAPPAEQVYPAGFATTVSVGPLAETFEGAHRGAAHFAGVATVVTKLLNIVAPDVAYFGQKDAQQLVVIRQVVRDLDIPVRIEAVPTVREPDGLALSSRNRRLTGDDRIRARALSQGLQAAEQAVAQGAAELADVERAARAAMALHAVEPEYVALVDPDTFAPLAHVNGRILVAVAARVGAVRLIDNTLIERRDR
jgi:pantoate--beta-alanine ligase